MREMRTKNCFGISVVVVSVAVAVAVAVAATVIVDDSLTLFYMTNLSGQLSSC